MPAAFSLVRPPRWVPSCRRRERTDQRLKILEVEIKGDSGPTAEELEERIVLAHRVTFSRTSAPLATRGSVRIVSGHQNLPTGGQQIPRRDKRSRWWIPGSVVLIARYISGVVGQYGGAVRARSTKSTAVLLCAVRSALRRAGCPHNLSLELSIFYAGTAVDMTSFRTIAVERRFPGLGRRGDSDRVGFRCREWSTCSRRS